MFERLLARIARALDESGIAYMVIGGQAVLVHGEPRLTKDIDVTLGATIERLPEVVALVDRLGFSRLVEPDTFTRETMVLPCQDPDTQVRVDFVLSDSAYERGALDRAVPIETAGVPVRFVSAADLLVHKVVAGRPRDLEDARAVLAKNPDVDRELVRSCLRELETAVEEPLVRRFDDLPGA